MAKVTVLIDVVADSVTELQAMVSEFCPRVSVDGMNFDESMPCPEARLSGEEADVIDLLVGPFYNMDPADFELYVIE